MGLFRKRLERRTKQYKSVDDYLKDLWRPMMAWVYAITVMFDFVIAPVLLGVYTIATGQKYIQWQPLTIQGGGMFHIAMGAVIGVSSYGHSQEKINNNDPNNPMTMPTSWNPATVRNGPVVPAYSPTSTPTAPQSYNTPAQPYSAPAPGIMQPPVTPSATPPMPPAAANVQPVNQTTGGFPRAKIF